MKVLVLILVALGFALPAVGAPSRLHCTSSDGRILDWNERYGELTVKTPAGDELLNLDGLRTGRSTLIETTPSMVVTPINDAREIPAQQLAEIQEVSGRPVAVLFDRKLFVCR